MSEHMASRECILIAIVAAAGDAGLNRVQLQKSAFLVGEEFDERLPANFYQFRPYMYGPFAQDVYTDLDRLCDGQVIEVLTGTNGRPSYRLAPGATTGLCGLSDLPEDLESGIRQIVGWVTSMSGFNELVTREQSIICTLTRDRTASFRTTRMRRHKKKAFSGASLKSRLAEVDRHLSWSTNC